MEDPKGPAPPPDWGILFAEAGLDPARWSPAEPRWTPPGYADARAAWEGSFPETPSIPIRVEAAAYRGKPTYFNLIGPWTRPSRMTPYQPTSGEQAGQIVFTIILLALMVGGVLLARRNLRLGRGDRRGASRLALAVFCILALSWLFGAAHVPSVELALFIMFTSGGLFAAAFLWILYVALEPFVRRRWPATIISWSRLLAGGWKDPLIGRDLLVGCVAGTTWILLFLLENLVPTWLGLSPSLPLLGDVQTLHGGRAVLAYTLNDVAFDTFASLASLCRLPDYAATPR